MSSLVKSLCFSTTVSAITEIRAMKPPKEMQPILRKIKKSLLSETGRTSTVSAGLDMGTRSVVPMVLLLIIALIIPSPFIK